MNQMAQWQAFKAVVEAGSFVAAADHLGWHKNMLSRLVASLEQRLGVRLLQRTTRRLALTEAGTLFYQRIVIILQHFDETEAEIAHIGHKVEGLIKISAPTTFGTQYLADVWCQFMQQYPDIRLDVQLTDKKINMIEEAIDIAIRIGEVEDEGLVAHSLSATCILLCAAPDYIKRKGYPEHPDDLVNHDTIGYTLASTGFKWRFWHRHEGSVHDVNLRPRFLANHGETCVQAGLAGVGLILQPAFMVQPYLQTGQLERVMLDFTSRTIPIQALVPTRRWMPYKIRCLIDFIRQALQGHHWID